MGSEIPKAAQNIVPHHGQGTRRLLDSKEGDWTRTSPAGPLQSAAVAPNLWAQHKGRLAALRVFSREDGSAWVGERGYMTPLGLPQVEGWVRWVTLG